MARSKRKKKKPTKFKEVKFKLSVRQKKSLEAYCKSRHTTPIKLIKRSIVRFLDLQVKEKPTPYPPPPQQLDLFEP